MHLHLVSFNVPWPADYGGVIDVFYRVKALSQAGIKVHLHTFTYGRPPADVLDELCEEVCYYDRDMSPWLHLRPTPFIVSSRSSDVLYQRLKQDDYPVLLEGVHCCNMLERLNDGTRKIVVRAHNVEHNYYALLSKSERRLARKLYLRLEAGKLGRYEPVLRKADAVLAVTEADAAVFRKMGCRQVVLMPTFHPDADFSALPGRGNYAFYHSNLSVPENIKAVNWLLDNVFSDSRVPFVIAGLNPDKALARKVESLPNVSLVASPSDEAMADLLHNAQVCVMVTDQPTGLKLKLLNSLYGGRHCLVNTHMVAGTSLGDACHVADTPDAMRNALELLMDRPFSNSDIELRKKILGSLYDNESNVRKLINVLACPI